jgi:hypothetical protein
MKKYRVITATNYVTYDQFIEANNRAEADKIAVEKIKAEHKFILIYCNITEEVA